jgi:hypothetical protein
LQPPKADAKNIRYIPRYEFILEQSRAEMKFLYAVAISKNDSPITFIKEIL